MKTSICNALIFSLASTFSLAALSRGEKCNKPLLPNGVEPGKSTDLTITSKSGVSPRKYRLHLPSTYDGATHLPLILSFHGRGKTGEFQEKLSQFSNSSYGFEGIAVYPEGVPFESNGKVQQWQGDPDAPSKISDVTFTLELLDELEKTYCIDTSRIYAAGKSNGGGFTGLLACDPDATKRIAAFAPVSGAFYLNKQGNLPACNPSRKPIPFMEFHGWVDKTIPYLGGLNTRGNANSTNIKDYVDDWAKRDGFQGQPSKSSLCQGKKEVIRYSWNDVVVHYNYSNLGHDWPSSFANGDTSKESQLTCKDAEATSIILKWFKKWTL